MTFHNPIIPGFYPDPSICRVGDDFYLATSSFEYFPGVPIFHSRDLVHWRQIGHCLTRKSQLPLEKARCSGGIFAPTLRVHNGSFYMITRNATHRGAFYVHTQNPAGEWSEPIWLEETYGDPSLFFDDDGVVYHTGCDSSSIVQSEIDLDTGKCLTETRPIWPGTGGRHPEGPHLYKIDGRYFLMIAEGGSEYGHMETIARSDTPWGPFESCPQNPILTHRNYSSPIQCTGHGDLIQAQNGSWWMVFLGNRPDRGRCRCSHLGRETFLTPVSWTDEGWPIVGDNGKVALEMEAECLPPIPREKENIRDDFDEPELRFCWNFLRNPHDEDWSLSERPGWLQLDGSVFGLDDLDSPAFVGRRQQHFDCEVSTLLDFNPQRDREEAGLTVRMNEQNHYEIAIARFEDERCVFVRRRIAGLSVVVAREKIGPGPVKLNIKADRHMYSFSCGIGDREPENLAQGETRYLSSEIAGGFTGVYLGLYATGNGKRSTTPAYFDWFDYNPLERESE
ncbi:MAG: glycoside hydrolase family 43 protein [Candidatus Latescibacteria bacterium]|nr:glycoside hydrolase family 43 protein [Candidatus Latescibacterota bacterium]